MKKFFLVCLMSCLFVPSARPASQDAPTEISQNGESESWSDWFMGLVIKTLMGSVPPTAVQNDHSVKHYEEQLKNCIDTMNDYTNDIGDILRTLKNDGYTTISQETWEAYVARVLKDPSLSQPSTSTDESKRLIVHLNNIITIHTNDNAALVQQWQNKSPVYENIQHQLVNAQPSYYIKPAMRCLGYTGVFLLGPYVGNKMYTAFLQSYFNQAQYNRSDLMQQIMRLEEQCDLTLAKLEQAQEKLKSASDAATESKLQTTIKRLQQTVDTMRQEIQELTLKMELPQEPSAWRTYAGIGVRVSMIALTTYLFYTVFKKIDDAYLVQHPLSEESLKALQQELEVLKGLKTQYDVHDATTQELKKMVQALNNKDHITHTIATLFSRLRGLIKIKQDITETKANLAKAKAQAAGQFMPTSHGWTA